MPSFATIRHRNDIDKYLIRVLVGLALATSVSTYNSKSHLKLAQILYWIDDDGHGKKKNESTFGKLDKMAWSGYPYGFVCCNMWEGIFQLAQSVTSVCHTVMFSPKIPSTHHPQSHIVPISRILCDVQPEDFGISPEHFLLLFFTSHVYRTWEICMVVAAKQRKRVPFVCFVCERATSCLLLLCARSSSSNPFY